MSPSYLFVYGTLLPGRAPASVADVVDRLTVVGPGTTPGRLYHLGAYPGCVVDCDCGRMIHGQLLELPDRSDDVLAKLDWYEDFVASDPGGRLFTRTTCRVTLGDGRQQTAWVYVYNRDVTRARLIESGRWSVIAGDPSQG